MKRFLSLALLGFSLHASADESQSKETPAQRKARISQTMEDALHDQQITQAQYEQSLAWLNAKPCAGIERRLSRPAKARLEAGIAKQQGRDKIRVFESFKHGGWTVVFSNAGMGDEPYYFYAGDPAKGAPPLTAWSGAATMFETSDIAAWVREQAPAIPVKLARCFAWHVTLDERSME